MSDRESILKILDKANIEFEESEDNDFSVVTEAGVEFVFTKKGGLKSVNASAGVAESVDREGMAWQYMDDELEEDE